MPDEPTPTTPPAADPPPTPATTPSSSPAADSVAMAKELGEAKARLAAAEARNQALEPVIETLYSDPDLLKKATEIHNKRTGVTPADPPAKPAEGAPPPPSETERDNRNALIKTAVDKFYVDKGIDKLEKDSFSDMNTRVGTELKEMLDPMGNKTLQQIMETVSVTKLPQYLEKAWFLATRNEQLEQAETKGQQKAVSEGMGVIGSIPSSSLDTSDVALSAKEREIAKKQGISEDKYLANKKEILARDGQLF